jgi:hypothetical protein
MRARRARRRTGRHDTLKNEMAGTKRSKLMKVEEEQGDDK